MAKNRVNFRCRECQATYPKWSGQCEQCGAWNTIEEFTPKAEMIASRNAPGGVAIDFSTMTDTGQHDGKRIPTGFAEADRVLGGGFFPDSLTLFVGNPGIGKSTLALQLALNIAKSATERSILIFSGEESVFQVKQRAERLGGIPPNLQIAATFVIEDVIATIVEHRPAFVIVDSAQTFSSREIPGSPGSMPQIRTITEMLMHASKTAGIPILLIGQVTKGGEMAGPQLLAHLVDTVLQFEGDDQHDLRILRSSKNRFGATSEVGIFAMTEGGLTEVTNPSEAFLSGRLPGAIGSTIYPALEGQRPFLVEIQALTATTPFGLPKRSASGIGLQRLSLLLAVLEKHANVKLSSLDVFANVVGGFRIDEPAADLAICLAVASSRNKAAVSEEMFFVGEVGLSGEVRAVSRLEQRLKEGEKLGFTTAIIPGSQKPPKSKLTLIPVRTVAEAVQKVLR